MIASVVVLCVTTVLAVLGAFRAGITTDEPIHVMRLRNLFDSGWYALDWDYRGDGPGSDGTNTFVYGPVTMLLLHAWSVLWGGEGWGEVSTSPHAYDVRHLGVVLIGLIGVAAVAAIGRVLLRHWRWGLVAAAALATIPMWTGHEMFNVKDTPVATGHTLVTLGLLLCVRAEQPRALVRLARAGSLIAGLVLTLGTRPGMWPGLFAVLLVAVVGVILAASRRDALVVLAEIAASCFAAAVALVAIYPNLFGSPFEAVPKTTEGSSSFMDGARSNRLYVPGHLGMEMPTLLLVFILTGAVVGVAMIWTQRRTQPVQAARIALVGVQAFAMPVVAIVMGSDLYHGLRQLLFAVPAMAVLAAYGMAWWRDRRPDRPRVFAAVATAALALPLIDQVMMQPYQTSYVNLATDLVATPIVEDINRPGADYWRVSIPELIEDVPLDSPLMCKATVDKKTDLAYSFTNGGEAFSTSRSLDCREEPNGPLAPQRLPVVHAASLQYDAVFLKTLPDNCTRRGEVTRRRHGFEYVLSILGRCTVLPGPLTEEGVRFDSPSLGNGRDHDLWRFAIDGWEQWPGDTELKAPVPQADLAFRPSPACSRTGCTLVIQGEAPDDLVVRVQGEEIATSRDADGALLVPITAAQASAGDGVWVTLARRTGGTLDVRLTGLALAETPAATTEGS